MDTTNKTSITISATVNAPIEKVWKMWNTPEDIKQWNAASDDWHTTKSEIDLREGGKFSSRMEAKDGSFGFDFWGIYETVHEHKRIVSVLGDERRLEVNFDSNGDATTVTETFETEPTHSLEQQREGWQAILNNFKKYAESK